MMDKEHKSAGWPLVSIVVAVLVAALIIYWLSIEEPKGRFIRLQRGQAIHILTKKPCKLGVSVLGPADVYVTSIQCFIEAEDNDEN